MSSYYKDDHLANFPSIGEGNSDLAKMFFDYYGSVFKDGALTAREKALIGIAVAHAIQCPYCIDSFTSSALEKGLDLEEMTEALHVASAIRGGATLVHGVQMVEQIKTKAM